jgi:hypothetical protein
MWSRGSEAVLVREAHVVSELSRHILVQYLPRTLTVVSHSQLIKRKKNSSAFWRWEMGWVVLAVFIHFNLSSGFAVVVLFVG